MIVVCGSSQIFRLFVLQMMVKCRDSPGWGWEVGGGELKLGIVSALKIN